MKKLKKRGLDDVEFFRSTAIYLQQCSTNAMTGKMEVRSCSLSRIHSAPRNLMQADRRRFHVLTEFLWVLFLSSFVDVTCVRV